MKAEDFPQSQKEQIFLHQVDSLVEGGLSRTRSERIVKQLIDLVEGPWSDMLEPFHDCDGTAEEQAERLMFQSCFIAFVRHWAQERIANAAITQSFVVRYLGALDSEELPNG